MWPLPADVLLFPLPDSFQASEDEHFFEIRCTRCGWRATFTVAGAQPNAVLKEVRAHRCPVPAPRLCANCKRPIGEQTRCPHCGADNPFWPGE